VVAIAAGDYGKPRPFLIVQTDAIIDTHTSLLACPLTSDLSVSDFRIPVTNGDDTGLRERSDVMVDKLQAVKRDRFGQRIGLAPAGVMQEVERALSALLEI
jgi:mRNA interferase MazF